MADDLLTREPALVRLASITRVKAYKRRGDKGASERVQSYVRKVHDAINSMGGPDVAAKRGINVNSLHQEAVKADKGQISGEEFAARLQQHVNAPAVNAPAVNKVAAKLPAGKAPAKAPARAPAKAPANAPVVNPPAVKRIGSEHKVATPPPNRGARGAAAPTAPATRKRSAAQQSQLREAQVRGGLRRRVAARPSSPDSNGLTYQDRREMGFPSNYRASYPAQRSTDQTPGWHKNEDPNSRNNGLAEMDDPTYNAHYEEVKKRVKAAIDAGQSTDQLHATKDPNDPEGKKLIWDKERGAAHQRIVSDLIEKAKASGVGNNKRAVMSGGLGGAGKSTVLGKQESGINKDAYLELNPDAMKDELIARGLAPEVQGLQPMEGAGLLHEESSHLALMLADAAQKQKMDVMWDITMASEKSVRERLDKLDGNGYDTEARFVDIPVETSVTRALSRHKRGVEDFLARKAGPGGRFVDPKHIRANQPEGSTHNSKNREVFEGLKDRFTDWQVWDNTGTEPVKVGEMPSGTRKVRSDGYTWVKKDNGSWVRDLRVPPKNQAAKLSAPSDRTRRTVLLLTKRN